MKKIILTVLLAALIASLNACSSQPDNSMSNDKNIEATDAASANHPLIEDINWSIGAKVVDGERLVVFDYTNNSPYTILSIAIDFTPKSALSSEEQTTLDELNEQFGDFESSKYPSIYIQASCDKITDPGVMHSNSSCRFNKVQDRVKDIAYYDIMEPNMATVLYKGDDNKGYTIYYDFINQSYGESTKEPIDLQKWSAYELGEIIPKPDSPYITVYRDEETIFHFRAYGISEEYYNDYIEQLKDVGFTDKIIDGFSSFRAHNTDGIEVDTTYYSDDECLDCMLTNYSS